MIRFIFGDAGTGKSTYIYQELTRRAEEEPHGRFFLFVPEQNTLRAQREIAATSPRHGMLHTDVLSFQLLAYRVMEELGIERPVILDDVSKSILIRRAAMEAAGELKVYRKKLETPGFIVQLKMLFSEFGQYGVRDEMLQSAEEKAETPLLKGKLSDIRCIFRAYQSYLSDKVTVPEEIPAILQKHIAASELLKDAVLYFDGYTGFTPVQLKLLEYILPKCREAVFAVSIPKEARPYQRGTARDAVTDLYWLSRETVYKVCRAAELNGIQRGSDVYLEQTRPLPKVEIYAAEDPTDEVRYAARSIRRLALQEGVRYQRMAVAVSDLAAYKEIIKRKMSAEGIPLFMDDKADALGSPVAECIRSALKCIVDGYDYDQTANYLKNPLLSGDEEHRDRVDRFDNLMRARGLRGRKAMERAEEDARQAAANAADGLSAVPGDAQVLPEVIEQRQEGLGLAPVFHLHDALRDAATVADKVRAVRDFCDELGLAERAAALSARLEAEGYTREALETERFVDLTAQLLERLEQVLGTERMGMKDFVRLIEAGFGDMKAGVIPEKMDMLVAGDLKRSRFENIDILYIIGANEGLLPSAVTGGGIFTDREREALSASSLELAPDDKTDSCIQQFYLYSLMHKPCHKLILSWASEDRAEAAQRPSEVVTELLEGKYPGFPEAAGVAAREEEAVSEGDALRRLSELTAQYAAGSSTDKKDAKQARFHELLRQLLIRDHTRERAMQILRAAFTGNAGARLSEETAALLYHDKLYGSVTRLEGYERCPFSHFLRYGLGLTEREEFDVEALDIGNLYHQSLDRIFRRIHEEGQQLKNLSDAHLKLLVREAVETVTESYHDSLMQASARNQFIARRVLQVTDRTVWALKRQFARGEFETVGTEVPFRYRDGQLDLHGVIDRVDRAEAENKVLVQIVDYKSGSTRFDLSLVLGGLQMQLVTYMDRALERIGAELPAGRTAAPAGMLYYHISDPVVNYDRLEKEPDPERLILSDLRMDGAVAVTKETLEKIDRPQEENSNADGAREVQVILESDNAEDVEAAKDALKLSEVISRSGTTTLREEDFRFLMRYTRERMQKDAGSILSGDIAIRPYRAAGKTGCDYCKYHSICGFDEGLAGYEYRRVPKQDLEGLRSLEEKDVPGPAERDVPGPAEKAVPGPEEMNQNRKENHAVE